MRERLIYFVLAYFLITLFSVLLYLIPSQVLRLLSDDPQVQITSDVIQNLKDGADPRQLSAAQTDIKTTDSPFVTIFDKKRKAVSSSGQLDKKIAVPPAGAFERADKNGESRFTWSPVEGYRYAAILAKYDNGFVLTARSLGETQRRSKEILKLAGLGWAVGMLATTFVYFMTRPKTMAKVEEAVVNPIKKTSRVRVSRKAKK
jgi:hypothetical protein